MNEGSASSYLSGLLIGREVRSMARKEAPVHVVGEPALCELYERALQAYGANATVEALGAALRRRERIAKVVTW